MDSSTSSSSREQSQPRRPQKYKDDGLHPAYLAYLYNGGSFTSEDDEGFLTALDVFESLNPDKRESYRASSYHVGLAVAAEIIARDGNVYYALECLISSLQDALKGITKRRRYPYAQYLESNHWIEIRAEALDRAGYACQLCGNTKYLQVHHKTYENLWEEQPDDLIVLCRDCHAKFHGKLP